MTLVSRTVLQDDLKAWTAFTAALGATGLPVEDLGEPDQTFFVFTAEGELAGYGGYMRAAGDVLLRSMVVEVGRRGRGYGGAILSALLSAARADGALRAWLLTAGAASFFVRHGFVAVERSEAPAAIAMTPQFSRICPASAALLRRDIAA